MDQIRQLPSEIKVEVLCANTGRPIEDIVVLLRAYVPRKNSYSFGPELTDREGVVAFAVEELKREVDLQMKTCPMDYVSNLCEATSFGAEIPDSAGVEKLIEARKLWGVGIPEWRLSKTMVEALRSAANRHYFPIERGASPESLLNDNCIVVHLRKLIRET